MLDVRLVNADDPRRVDPGRIGDIVVVATLVAGEPAHGTEALGVG